MNPHNASRIVLQCAITAAILGLHPAALTGESGPTPFVSVPPVPPALKVPSGNLAFLKAGAAGTQNYICMPSGWNFIGPRATLFVTLQWINGPIRQQVTTHFLTPNEAEDGKPRPAWQSSMDSSIVQAAPIASSTDPAHVDPTSIPWLLLQTVGAERGPTGGSILSQTTFIQRVNTSGGMMPATACTVGDRAFVPYTADYIFYRKAGN